MPIFLAGEVAPKVRSHPAALAAGVAAVVAVAGRPLPHHLGLLAGIVLGVAAATWSER